MTRKMSRSAAWTGTVGPCLRVVVGVVAVVWLVACHSALSPAGTRYLMADRGIIALGTLQSTAIALNRVQACDPEPCHPLLSNTNTRVVVEAVRDAVTTLRQTPDGWRAIVTTALEKIRLQLDASALKELGPYLATAEAVMASGT